ncbi:asparagine synthase [Ectopseudomonas mendocina NK-01]|uniref:asparagine synthase (glutamine-hydrolyzing) n=2 Tax=Ectopseudomonas mendocina TaxID=300 RepID=A0A379IY07_ECTME|nr:asparagine synthetase B [Pseudomonas mendocina]AEB57437.1 asparagine synthase [Pseudomonas mendocina NK-01]SUD41149.1 asparagine synthase [Pseudomonas mendocina]
MSAIAGIVRFDGQALDRSVLQRMSSILAPYGRDAQGTWHGAGVGLVRTLLRTTPEDRYDRQPVASADCQVVFAGRLDNRDELIAQLALDKRLGSQMADSELMAHACQRWDTLALERVEGSYALACWQPQRRRLWLARDVMGGQPLFWHRQSGFLAFASWPKALFCVPGVPRSVDEQSVLEQLALLPMAGCSFKDIQRVNPGEFMLVEGNQLSTHVHRCLGGGPQVRFKHDEDYVEALHEHLQRAVSACLRSSGPVASHLSSGFDSSTVTAYAARQLAHRGERLTAYTAAPREGFAGPVPRDRHGDESKVAAQLAGRFDNIDHVILRSSGQSPLESLEQEIDELDQSPVNPCNTLWMRAIERDAQARGCKVMLTGQMGNMSISYDGYPYMASLWRKGRWLQWWHELCAYQRTHPQWRRRGLVLRTVGASMPGWLWNQVVARREGRDSGLYHYTAVNLQQATTGWLQQRAAAKGWDLNYRPWHDGRAMRLAVLRRVDTGSALASANLRGLEMRDPTYDRRLVEFCLGVPDSQFLRDGQPRWLLRRLMADVLPEEILEGRGKGYQFADWYEGLTADRERLREQLYRLRQHRRAAQLLDLPALEALLENWPEEGWADMVTIRNYRLKLLRGVAMGNFIRYAEPDNR